MLMAAKGAVHFTHNAYSALRKQQWTAKYCHFLVDIANADLTCLMRCLPWHTVLSIASHYCSCVCSIVSIVQDISDICRMIEEHAEKEAATVRLNAMLATVSCEQLQYNIY
jgi:hypothetical protein